METPISSEEGLVCQTCGAEGFTNAFIYCVNCLGYVIHRYCLLVMPETYDEFVVWHCDDCETRLPYHFTSPPKHNPNEDPPNSALVKTTKPRSKRKKKPLKKHKFGSLVAEEEDNKCVSGANQIPRCVVLGLAKREHNSLQFQEKVATHLEHVNTTKCNKKKIKSVLSISCPQETAESNCQKSVETPPDSLLKEALMSSDSGANPVTTQSAELDTDCFPIKGIVKRKRDTLRVAAKTKKQIIEKSIEHSSCESSCTDAALKNVKDITHTEERLTCALDHDKSVSNSSSSGKELNKGSKEFNGTAYASQSAYLENNVLNIDNQLARPVLDPIWRGSFSITQTDYDLFEGFVGHLSNKACKRVFEEANTLPSMLSLEMHSKAHLWPKSFLDSMPSDESIALYFFPGDTKNERGFEQLVNDMIDTDLAMKTTAKNAELLIFTSKVLPQSYWRFQGNYYLWGVFRRKKNDAPVAVANRSDNHVLSANSGIEVTSEKETLKRVKTIESHSPQSPLCSYR